MVYTNRLAGNCFTNIRIFIKLFFEKLFKKNLFLKNVRFKCFQFAFSPVVPLISFTSIRSSITSFYIPCSDTINRYMQVAIKYLWEEKRRKKFWLFHGWPSSSVDNFPGFILSSSHSCYCCYNTPSDNVIFNVVIVYNAIGPVILMTIANTCDSVDQFIWLLIECSPIPSFFYR